MEDFKEIKNKELDNVNGGLMGSTFDIYITCGECGTKQVIKKTRSRYSPGEHWDFIGKCCACNVSIYYKIPRGPAKFIKEDK